MSSFKLGFCQQSSGQSIGGGWKSILAIELQLGLEEKIFFQEEQMAHSQDQVSCACIESLLCKGNQWSLVTTGQMFLQMPSVRLALFMKTNVYENQCLWKPMFMKTNVYERVKCLQMQMPSDQLCLWETMRSTC